MEALVPITLYGWIVVAIALFAVVPPRRAVIAAFILAWLFLPQAGIPMVGFPDLDKITATSLGALLGVLIFDAGRLARFRPSWVDIPMLVWCISSIPSSLTNDLGWYDGLSGVNRELWNWGVPYFIGRLYFKDFESLRELAIGLFIGGLLYVPLCLYEWRMSPQLHKLVYGFHPSNFAMTIRYGGYRPMVFMQHGLMVGMWMTSASLVGVWLWASGSLKRLFGAPMWLLVMALCVTTVMCKSTGAIALLALGLGVLFVSAISLRRYSGSSSALIVLVLSLTPLYMVARAQGWWGGEELISISKMVSDERADSLAGRLENESKLIAQASKRPWFGWGGWGRWRVKDPDTGKDVTVSDGMWVITRGEKGMVGLVSVTAIILMPIVLLLRRVPARYWAQAALGAPAALAILLMLYSIDNLFNAMLNPIFLLGAGGLSSLYVEFPRIQAAIRRAYVGMLSRAFSATGARGATFQSPLPLGAGE